MKQKYTFNDVKDSVVIEMIQEQLQDKNEVSIDNNRILDIKYLGEIIEITYQKEDLKSNLDVLNLKTKILSTCLNKNWMNYSDGINNDIERNSFRFFVETARVKSILIENDEITIEYFKDLGEY